VTKTWLTFTEIADSGKTKIWSVDNAHDMSYLGLVKWHGPWRQYVFVTPGLNTIWNPACLDEMSAFIRTQMEERKNG
jgi:hypothetical protein